MSWSFAKEKNGYLTKNNDNCADIFDGINGRTGRLFDRHLFDC